MVEGDDVSSKSIEALAVGRLVPVKNFTLLLNAWSRISIPLKILGEGPMRKNLEKLVDQLDLSERVTFLGYRNDVIEQMQAAALVVIPSIREGFGYVTLGSSAVQMCRGIHTKRCCRGLAAG